MILFSFFKFFTFIKLLNGKYCNQYNTMSIKPNHHAEWYPAEGINISAVEHNFFKNVLTQDETGTNLYQVVDVVLLIFRLFLHYES